MNPRPYWVVVLLLSLTLGVVAVRGDQDKVPPSQPLSSMPTIIDGKLATDIPLSDETLAVLGKGDFLSREYIPTDPTLAHDPFNSIDLFIGYFPTQRTGQSIHSPQNCLPGAGWTFIASGVIEIPGPNAQPYRVGDYTIADGGHKAEVLYWYQSQGRAIASDYAAKLNTLANSIRYGRTDAALVRISTMYREGESRDQARQRVVDFAQKLTPLLPAYIPN
jgi:EpsI family protein